MDRPKTLLQNNQAWMQQRLQLDDQYFRRSAEGQAPPFLWIGCADSRVVPELLTGSEPGDLFVHRNIANVVSHSDLNLMSVLEYGILPLRVDHIIVCGHTRCGGVNAALGHQRLGLIDQWIRNIKDVYDVHESELSSLEDEQAVWDRLVELNVQAQVMNLAKTPFVQQRWQEGEFPILHGWNYRIEEGRLDEISKRTREDPMDSIYRYDFGGGEG